MLNPITKIGIKGQLDGTILDKITLILLITSCNLTTDKSITLNKLYINIMYLGFAYGIKGQTCTFGREQDIIQELLG